MTSVCRLRPDISISLLAGSSGLRRVVQAMIVSVALTFIGPADASETPMGQAVELTLRAVSRQVPGAELPATRPHELAAKPATQNAVTVRSQKRSPATPLRHRNPELSAQDLVVVSINAAGAETSRTIIRDPRIVRAETGAAPGQLKPREFLYRNEVTFSVLVADPSAVAVKLYKPRWTGKAFVLDLIGEADLPEHG